jgi:hypothetical protein
MLMLLAMLGIIYAKLATPQHLAAYSNGLITKRPFNLAVLAQRSASKQPLRSTLTILLMATASFLIIAISAFRLEPDAAGTGGFDLIGQTSQPLYRDWNDPNARSEWLGSDQQAMKNAAVAMFRVRPGQDASCNNLYQAQQPTVLGIAKSSIPLLTTDNEAGFRFIAGDKKALPWHTLVEHHAGTQADPVPVIIDQNTAMWSLKMIKGVGEIRKFDYGSPQPIYFKVVGLLEGSVLQGNLIIGESSFQTLFPHISGYQYFLIRTLAEDPQRVASILESRLSDAGMDTRSAVIVLAELMAVQNTYLRTFQSLGMLGLLLGTIGLAIAQVRSIVERRSELALLTAIGFSRLRLASLVLSETMFLLVVGLTCGAGCAVLSVLPYAWTSGTRPPLWEPLVTLVMIALFGMLSATFALRSLVRLPLLQSLRAQ